MPYTSPPDDQITTWPPKPKAPQVTRAELRRMTPGAIEEARAAGALVDVLAGKKDAAILEERE